MSPKTKNKKRASGTTNKKEGNGSASASKAASKSDASKKWSAKVTQESGAVDLELRVFKKGQKAAKDKLLGLFGKGSKKK